MYVPAEHAEPQASLRLSLRLALHLATPEVILQTGVGALQALSTHLSMHTAALFCLVWVKA